MSYDRQCSSCGGICGRGGCERENVKPEQEPVAWTTKGQIAAMDSGFIRYIEGRDPRFVLGRHDDVPLYTTPPARKPLTDEEMRDAFLADPDPIFKLYKVSAGLSCAELDEILKRVARAIERAHGIGDE